MVLSENHSPGLPVLRFFLAIIQSEEVFVNYLEGSIC